MYNQSNNRPGYNRGGQNSTGYGKPPRRDEPTAPIEPLEIPADFLEQAEKLMCSQEIRITTSKIRRLYSLVTEIYNEEQLRTQDMLTQESVAALGMMRVRIAYECGRDASVKAFVAQTKLLQYLKSIGTSRMAFIKYTQYMEALVAYHKFYGGREN